MGAHSYWILVPTLLLAAGCATFSRFGTARTGEVGESRWTVTLDGGEGSFDGETPDERIFVPTPHLRWEKVLAPQWELGVEAGVPGMVGADVKRELLRSTWFDLAVAPGVSAGLYSSDGPLLIGQVPIIADVVLTDWLVLVPHLSAGWGATFDDREDLNHSPLVGGGLGVWFRLGDGFAVQPTVSSTWELDTLYVHRRIGLAISFGPQPGF